MIEKDTLFMVRTNCPIVQFPITLRVDTWHKHITRNHPEMAGRLNEIEHTVIEPDYMARSKPGPGGRYEGNLVFVGLGYRIRTSHLHVFLERRGAMFLVGTAIFSKSSHGDRMWTK